MAIYGESKIKVAYTAIIFYWYTFSLLAVRGVTDASQNLSQYNRTLFKVDQLSKARQRFQ